MAIYVTILAVVSLACLAGAVNNTRFSRAARLTLYAPVFLILVLPAAYRWRTGWDWEAYDAMVAAAPTAPLGSNSGDFLFDVVLRWAAWQHISIYAICALVIVGGFFLIASRWCPTTSHMSIALAFFLWYGYYGAWSTIRQGTSIVFFRTALLTSRTKYRWLAFAAAALLHRSALLPIGIYVLYSLVWPSTSAASKAKRLTMVVVGAVILALRLMPSEVSSYFIEFSVGFFGGVRASSLARHTFFIEPYPLITGRMIEICITLLVLGRLGKCASPDTERYPIICRLYNLQVLHLLTYLVCSPITFIAERQVLFFDYVHCLALSHAVIISGLRVADGKGLGWLRPFHRRNCVVSLMAAALSLGYMANRYANMLSADSRDPAEMTHRERFIPYQAEP